MYTCDLKMQIPEPIIHLLKVMEQAGGEGYLVGGALRDLVMKREVKDYDVATSLHPDKVLELFKMHTTFEVGKKYGTITVIIDEIPIEVTTYRGEMGYSDFRHPDQITFVSDICEDLSRRDFTINAMAYNPLKESGILDPFGGLSDIAAQQIRTVGRPDERFFEDPLRILRAVRFAARLGFTLHPETYRAMELHHALLNRIAEERIRIELFGILLATHTVAGIRLMKNSGILKTILALDENEALVATGVQIAGSLHYIDALPLCASFRMAALLHTIFMGPNIMDRALQTLKRLRFDKATLQEVLKLLESFPLLADCSPYTLKKIIGEIGYEKTYGLLSWYYAYKTAEAVVPLKHFEVLYHQSLSILIKIQEKGEPVTLKDLAITGNDVMENMDIDGNGKLVGQALHTAYEWVLQHPEDNQKEILLERLRQSTVDSNGG